MQLPPATIPRFHSDLDVIQKKAFNYLRNPRIAISEDSVDFKRDKKYKICWKRSLKLLIIEKENIASTTSNSDDKLLP